MNRRITIELDDEAIAAAEAASIDLSELLTAALRRRLPSLHPAQRERAARVWYEENKAAVDSYNDFIERHGLLSDGIRKF